MRRFLAKSGLAGLLGTYLAADANDRRDGIARIEEQAWKGLDPAWLTENTGIPGDSDYSGFVFAHTASQAGKPGAAFRACPSRIACSRDGATDSQDRVARPARVSFRFALGE